ncbi:MAG: ribonuclease III [Pyrinomonadaceae bacterium]|nr:ribonuclease III [Pyrinomonadaceae bacterium]MCX7640821.1 ribonuclease III [Pyrinomonadaceae bacterium]MDW8303414.1 ribonuclease III [Acidobacteriota bacterium]
MTSDLVLVEKLLGYTFQDKSLLKRALTHRSWVYEKFSKELSEEEIHKKHNENLEFIGDAVLGLAIVEALCEKHGDLSEGKLTLMKHFLTSASVIAKVAEKLNLGKHILISQGEEKTGGRSKKNLLADCFEAIVGAIFLDSGYVSARSFVRRAFIEELREVTPETCVDYKTLLQEVLQARKSEAPKYRVVETSGPAHKPTFYVEVSWDGGKAIGRGSSKKQAEMMAASLALEKIKQQEVG